MPIFTFRLLWKGLLRFYWQAATFPAFFSFVRSVNIVRQSRSSFFSRDPLLCSDPRSMFWVSLWCWVLCIFWILIFYQLAQSPSHSVSFLLTQLIVSSAAQELFNFMRCHLSSVGPNSRANASSQHLFQAVLESPTPPCWPLWALNKYMP